METRIIRTGLSIAIAITVIIAAMYYRDSIIDTFYVLRIEWVLFGFFFYLMTYLFRAMRLKTLADNKIYLWPDSFYFASLHGFATYILPFRSGDISLPIILKTMSRMNIKEGITVLYKARLMDVVTLGIWTFLSSIYPYWEISHSIRGLLLFVGIIMCFAPFIMGKILERLKQFDGLCGQLIRQLRNSETIGIKVLLQSTGIWVSLAACFYCIATAIGLTLQVSSVWLLIVIQMPLQLIPLQGIANSGNHEGGWIAGLKLIGLPTSAAIKFAIISHAILLLYVLLIGPIAIITGLFYQKRN